MGLANLCVPQDQVRTEAMKLAAEIAECSPLGLISTRATMRAGLADRVTYAIGWVLVYRPLRHQIGLARAHVALSGAAPVSLRVLEFFWSMAVPIREGYGMTENTAIAACARIERVHPGTVGPAMPGVELALAADGEILTRSDCVFAGYLHDPEATAAVLDPDGWLHTGDKGSLDADGYLRITGRIKELFKTSGGKYIAPPAIEAKFKAICPYASQFMVFGNERNYCIALVTLDPDSIVDWAKENNLVGKSYSEIVSSDACRAMVAKYVDELNNQLNRWETIKKFELLDHDLSVESGELTPSMKVKRNVVETNYSDVIDKLYT